MSAAFGTQAFQQSRHARRIYVGGFPPNYGDEEALKFFLNSVIAKGLGEPNDNSYVLSIYVNQKKCFAFVELRAIELATACLDLDGIIYKKVVLKVLRANEYKPELIPPSMVGSPITLDLSSFSFGIPTTASSDKINNSSSAQSSMTGNTSNPTSLSENLPDARLDSVIQFASLSYVSTGCISIIGYPFDDRAAPNYNNNNSSGKESSNSGGGALNLAVNLTSHSTGHTSSAASSAPAATTGSGSGGYTGLGCTQAPKKMRNMIRKYKFGLLQNPEYEVDLKKLKFIDVGDVQAGKTREDTKSNLSTIVCEVVQRRAVPFVVGGSSDCAYYTALGSMAASVGRIGMVVISAQLEDTRVLDDPRMNDRHSSTQTAGIALLGAPGLTNSASGNNNNNNHGAYLSPEGEMSPENEKNTNCGGRYVRFAAQGLQCTTQQAENVTSKGGHIVWLGRDIRNQSSLCSIYSAAASEHGSALAGRAVPHVYTLALFREALRCAAGAAAVSAETDHREDKSEEESSHLPSSIYRVESQDFGSRPDKEESVGAVAAVDSDTSSVQGSLHGGGDEASVDKNIPTSAAASGASSPTAHSHGYAHNNDQHEQQRGGVVVSIDMGVLAGAVRGCGYITGSSNSATGLTIDEILDIVMIAGADPNVLSLDISEFSPDAEDTRSSMLLAQMFYQFSLGVASRPSPPSSAAKSLGRPIPPITSMDVVDPPANSFMFGEATGAAVMRVPFKVTVDRSGDQFLPKDLGSLSKTPKYYQEVSSGSMEAFTGTGNPATESAAVNLPYVEVDNRLSSMDSFDIAGLSDGPGGHLAFTKGVAVSMNNSLASGKQHASPSQFVASPPTLPNGVSANLASASTEAFQKQLYPTGIPPQYVSHSQTQRAALQAADVAGMFGGMVRTSPGSTPTGNQRRLGSTAAASPPLSNRSMTTGKPTPGLLGVNSMYPPNPVPRSNQAGHLTQQQQHQQLFAQQALHLQQQQALYAQRPAQPPQYRNAPPPPPSASPIYGAPQTHQAAMQNQYGGGSAGAVPSGYPQQRNRYEPEQSWPGDRPEQSQRYGQPSPVQRQQPQPPLHSQHQLQHQQLYRMQQQQGQSAIDDRAPSPQYLSQDFLDITGERIPNSSRDGNYLDRLGGQGHSNRSSSTSSDLSGALVGLGVGTELSHSSASSDKARSIARVNANHSSSTLNDMHGFDEPIDVYEFRMQQQQQQQQAQQARGRSAPQQQQQPSQARGGAQPFSTSPMYSLYSGSAGNSAGFSDNSLNFGSGGNSLNGDLIGSLVGGSNSLLFSSTSPHSTSSTSNSNQQNLVGAPSAGGAGQNSRSDLDHQADFMQEHYNQFS